ncbi:MAG: M56 family metallopeptidase [Ruminiclostridium sp.]|nr:M56 family metallopeptidase [Ruminiclostridium sp.]
MIHLFIYVLISSVMCSLCGLLVLLLNKLIKGVSEHFKCNILTMSLIVPLLGFPAGAVIPFVIPENTVPAVTIYEVHEIEAVTYNSEEENETLSGKTHLSSPASPFSVSSSLLWTVLYFAGIVWASIAVGMFILISVRFFRSNAILRRQRKFLRNAGKLPVYTIVINISPFLTNIFRPAIYIPEGTYSEDELELVIAHETAHYRRGDLLRRLLTAILSCINWFNPLYRYVLKKLTIQTEFACDEAVTNGLTEEQSKSYGYMLLKTAENGIENRYLTVGLGSDAGNLKRRIKNIMTKDKKCTRGMKFTACAAFTASALLCIGGCGSSVAVIAPPQQREDEGIWMSTYFNDRSEVPQTLFTGKYYLTDGGSDSYIAIDPDGTLEIHCDEYFSYLEQYETAERFGEEEARFAAERREFLKSSPRYSYDSVMGMIRLIDPDDPDGERIYNRWFAVHTTEYDIMIECHDKSFYFRKPVYEVNENGQTYGFIPDAASEDEFPDLIPVIGDNGKAGYVYEKEFSDVPSSIEEAAERRESIKNGTYEPRSINVYEADGKTVIDTFTESPQLDTEHWVLNEDGTYKFIGE